MPEIDLETNPGRRAIGLLGLASFLGIAAAALVAPPLWDAPPTEAPAAQVAAYVQGDRGRILASLLLYSLAIGLFLCFAAALALRLRSLERGSPWRSALLALSAATLVALILTAFAPAAVNAYRAQPPALSQALNDTTFALLAMSGVPTAIMLGAYASLVLPSGALPRWTGWLALLGVAAHLAIATSILSREGFLSLEGAVIVWAPATFFAWILATSLVLLARPARSGT